jgi:2-C-methyl-D-erythritol 4-phosphate cytidylyltransferase
MKIAVILPAAGSSKRFSAAGGLPGANKLEQDLVGRPVFLRSIELFLNRPVVGQIILAVNPDDADDFRFRWRDKLAFHGVTIVPGGKAERWETVLKALDAVRPDCTHAAIHDAARPLASAKLIDRVFEAAQKRNAVIPGLPVAATLKRVAAAESESDADPLDAILGGAGKPAGEIKRVVETVDRRDVVEVQTPQVFELGLLRRAYGQITSGKLTGAGITDAAGLVESLGETVYVVEGESTNFKITRPDDLKLAQAYVQATEQKEVVTQAKRRLFKDDDE